MLLGVTLRLEKSIFVGRRASVRYALELIRSLVYNGVSLMIILFYYGHYVDKVEDNVNAIQVLG